MPESPKEPQNAPSPLSPKNDFVFKRLFGDPRYIELTEAIIVATLGWPKGTLTDLVIVDPNLNQEFEEGKRCALDVRAKASGQGKSTKISL